MNSKHVAPFGFGLLLIALILFLLNGNPELKNQLIDLDGSDTTYVGEEDMPDGLHPVVKKSKEKLVKQAGKKDIDVVITEGYRSIEEQNALYAQGRSEEGKIVTNAEGGTSYHNYGLAIDFALRNERGKIIWDTEYDGNGNGTSDWMEVVDIAKELGFTWGGDWNHFRDYPHLQMTFGLRINQLKNGMRPAETAEAN